MKPNTRNLFIAVVLVVVALALTAWLAYRAGRHSDPVVTSDSKAERDVLYWFDPMVPDKQFDKPGKSPFMDMQLVPRYADEVMAAGVKVAAEAVQSLGLRSQEIVPRQLAARIDASASVAWNLRREARLDTAVDAQVVRLWVKAPYESIAAGAPVAALEAPAWASAIAEYLALRDADSAEAKALAGDARRRLQRLGLAEADIRAAERGGQRTAQVIVHAPVGGVVTELPVREGQWLRPGDLLARINPLDSVWLEAALPQAQAAQLSAGASVSIAIDALGGTVRQGEIEQVLPQIDPRSRTQTVRIVLANPDGALVPGQFARVTLNLPPGEPALWVPDDALILTGVQARLALDEGEGRYRIAVVGTGRRAQGHTEIRSGLGAGQRVVLSGQFLLDSEASVSQSSDTAETEAEVEPADAHSEHRHEPASAVKPGDQP
jgi:Cu(I)/Ag(I) efflux system membrane fusion protein